MSKYTVSKLNSVDKLNETDLLLVSRDNGDGTYSSVNVPFSVVADAVNEKTTGSNVVNGSTDKINYFAPTTRIKIKESAFYNTNDKAAILLTPDSKYAYINKDITIYKQNKDANHIYTDEDAHIKLVKGTPAAGYLPKVLLNATVTIEEKPSVPDEGAEEVPSTEEENQVKTVTYTFIVSPDLTNTFASDVAGMSGKQELKVVQSYLTFISCTSGTSLYIIDSTSTQSNPEQITIEDFNERTNITNFDMSNAQRKTYSKTYTTYIHGSYKYIKMLDNKIYSINTPAIIIKGKKTNDKTVGSQNTAVYTDELIISDDSAIYLYGSFTCDQTTSKGESYYFEIQLYCDLGDREWFPIYSQYSTQPNANGRTTINYQLYAKAGTKIRGYIAPQGSSNNIYYNLSNFAFTQAIVNDQFEKEEKFDIPQIPVRGFMSEAVEVNKPENSTINGYWISIEGAFSRYGAYNDDNDITDNMYFACALQNDTSGIDNNDNVDTAIEEPRIYVPFHTVVLTNRNATYSTYKYFIPCSGTNVSDQKSVLRIFSSTKVGNNSNYPPYGSNSAKVSYTAVNETLSQLLGAYKLDSTKASLFDATELEFDAVLSAPIKRKKISSWRFSKARITQNFNGSHPGGRVGVSKVVQCSDSTATDNELYVTWKRKGQTCPILENVTGATSLYWMPSRIILGTKNGKPSFINTLNYSTEDSLPATLTISNNLEQLKVSDAKKTAEIHTAKTLTSIKKLGKKLNTFIDYCFYKCENLTSIPSSDYITTIGEYAFSGCKKLQGAVSFPNAKSIGVNAFANCEKVTSINVQNCEDRIPSEFALKCASLNSADIRSAAIIGTSAFAQTAITSLGCTNNETTRADNVQTISKQSFSMCKSLVSVNLNKCIHIGQAAFNACTELTTLNLTQPAGSSIEFGTNAFAGCPLSGDIHLGNVSTIGNGAFAAASKDHANFIFSNTAELPALKSTNAFPNNANKNKWTIQFANDTIKAKAEKDKIWRQFKTRFTVAS